jgi:tripeptidyl-peptidase I
MFAPSDESVTAVRHWLTTSGIHDIRITHSENKGWLAFIASGDELETLLHADFYEYEDSHTGDKAIVSDRYHVPKNLREHIDYITPGIRFPFLRKRAERDAIKAPLQVPAPASLAKTLAFNATSCDEAITPGCIAAMYQIPRTSGTPSPNNSLGIYETADVYSQSDLNDYFATYPSYGIPNGTAPTLDAIDGASLASGIVAGESNLDFSLAYPIVYPQNITLYQVRILNSVIICGNTNRKCRLMTLTTP